MIVVVVNDNLLQTSRYCYDNNISINNMKEPTPPTPFFFLFCHSSMTINQAHFKKLKKKKQKKK
jgi:hypothetical protein